MKRHHLIYSLMCLAVLAPVQRSVGASSAILGCQALPLSPAWQLPTRATAEGGWLSLWASQWTPFVKPRADSWRSPATSPYTF